jgi:thiopurine S-methyltransferase
MNEDWIGRWRDGRIGFHEGRPNGLLERHADRLSGCRRVLVPLCGKAEDMAWLAARGHEIVGVELAEAAVQAFFTEHQLTPSITKAGSSSVAEPKILPEPPAAENGAVASEAGAPYTVYQAGPITILVGDVFALTPALLGPIDALYDRGALIALPPELRPRYVALLRTLLPAGAPALVIAVEYDEAAMTGPPFAVFEPELHALYAGAKIELLDERPAPPGGKCSQLGVPATERCFSVRESDPRS